jgi:hopanoid biosynthesis associated protein HpnK
MKRLPEKRLVVTADDFGMSVEVNEAVEEAHREGILTCASLAVTGAAVDDALRRARSLPDLGVGLHLALYGAEAASPGPSLLSPDGRNLGEGSIRTGAAIMLSNSTRAAARREIAAQFDAYRRTGLRLGHLDGHWHCHQHPAVLAIALELGRPLGLRAVRVPYEPYGLSHDVAGGERAGARAFHALSHWPLAAAMRRQIRAAGMVANDRFFGKTDAGHLGEALLLRLAPRLPAGLTELGLHPATRNWSGDHVPPASWQPAAELAALTSPAVRAALDAAGVTLCRWQDVA